MSDDWEPAEFTGATCRWVELPDGQGALVRGDGDLGPEGVAALAQLVSAVQRHHESTHPPDPGAADLYARLDAAREVRGVGWRELSRLVGVPASALTRLAQGTAPLREQRAALEEWLVTDSEPTELGPGEASAK